MKAENALLKFAVLALTIGSLFLMVMTYRAMEKQTIVLLPPTIDEKVIISGTDVNDGYLRLYTRHVCTLLLNYTYSSANAQFRELLEITSPQFMPDLKNKLDDNLIDIQKLKITSTFIPKKLVISRDQRLIEVSGYRRKYSNQTLIDESQETYLLNYAIQNGRFSIDGITQKQKAS